MIIQHYRFLWRRAGRGFSFNVNWPIIRRDSYVVVTASEARISAVVPDRFIGRAIPILAANVTPQDGRLSFVAWWEHDYGDFPYLNIWTDISVFDPADPSGTG